VPQTVPPTPLLRRGAERGTVTHRHTNDADAELEHLTNKFPDLANPNGDTP
jgi:hypothetical protein